MKDYVNVHFYKTLKVTKLVSTAAQTVVCFFCLFAVSKIWEKISLGSERRNLFADCKGITYFLHGCQTERRLAWSKRWKMT